MSRKDAYDKFISRVEKEFHAAVDETTIEECLADFVIYMVADGFFFDNTRLSEGANIHKPLTVRLSSEDNAWLKGIDLEREWESVLNDYGNDPDMGEQIRDKGKVLVDELRRVARKLELKIIKLENEK